MKINLPFLFLLLFGTAAHAKEYRLLDVEKIGFEGYQIEDYRDEYFPYAKDTPEHWTVGAAFVVNLTFVAWREYSWYWDNRPHMASTNVQVREAGWEWETGLSYRRRIDLFWHHHSRHILDTDVPGHYPLFNSYGLRVIFYERGQPW